MTDYNRILSIIEHLQTTFSDEAVALAEATIEQDPLNQWSSTLLIVLLQGRNALARREWFEDLLKKKGLTLPDSTSSDSEPIEQREDLAEPSTASLILEIEAGGFPSLKLLSTASKMALFDELRRRVQSAPDGRHSHTYLSYLLHFDNLEEHQNELLELAEKWCIERHGDVRSAEVIAFMVNRFGSPELVSIAGQCLDERVWAEELSYYLPRLLKFDSHRNNRKRFKTWYKYNPEQRTSARELSAWLEETGCGRRVLSVARIALAHDRLSNAPMLDVLHRFRKRRIVRSWFNKYLRTNIADSSVRKYLVHRMAENPTALEVKLAMSSLKLGTPLEALSLLAKVVSGSKDRTAHLIARDSVVRFPNGPMAFSMARSLMGTHPDFARPWLLEWIKTAEDGHRCEALTAILMHAPDAETLAMARSIAEREIATPGSIPASELAGLLTILLKLQADSQLISLARSLLLKSGDVSLEHQKRLCRLNRILEKL